MESLQRIALFSMLFYVCMAVCAAGFLFALFCFFRFRISYIFTQRTGRGRERTLAQMRSRYDATGGLRPLPIPSGSLSDALTGGKQERKAPQPPPASAQVEKTATTLLAAQGEETATTLLAAQGEETATTLLTAQGNDTAATPPPAPPEKPPAAAPQPPGAGGVTELLVRKPTPEKQKDTPPGTENASPGRFELFENTVFLHTQELI